MASQADICNLALSKIGDTAQIASITEASPQAKHCKQWYDIARDKALSDGRWGFATRRILGPAVALPDTVTQWRFAYGVPASCLDILAVLRPGAQSEVTELFVLETLPTGARIILTNVETATLRYIERVTDTTRYPVPFVMAMSTLLGSFISGPIRKDVKTAAALRQMYSIEIGEAAASDANGQHGENRKRDHVPASIAARRGRIDHGLRGSDDLPSTNWSF